VSRFECADCGITPMDLPDGVDPEFVFERDDDGAMRCQGCQAATDAGWPKASDW